GRQRGGGEDVGGVPAGPDDSVRPAVTPSRSVEGVSIMAIDLLPAPAGAGADEEERAFWRNAHFLALASNLAYLAETNDDAGVSAQFRSQLGATAAVLLPRDRPDLNAQYVVAETDADVVVAFRGTEDPFAAR